MLQIRQSANKKFYYLVEIDAKHNETVLGENADLAELKKHPKVKGQKLEPIPEEETRGTVEPPKQTKTSRSNIK